MDTRYWGPSGWKLLHTITFSYKSSLKDTYKKFFTTLAYVLPCKFCRKSYSEYLLEDPVQASSKKELTEWLWRIHNKVNNKLRSQGLPTENDPPFKKVKQVYEDILNRGCSKVSFEGWEFMFSVVEGHPLSRSSKQSASFDLSGLKLDLTNPFIQNMYNFMKPENRFIYYKEFWKILPEILPFQDWRTLWKKQDCGIWNTRKESLTNLYSIRCSIERELELQNRTKYSSLCKELRHHKSGCNKSKRSITCRKKRKN